MSEPVDLSEFLRSRRAQLQPADIGLVSYGTRRRVPGLRREELAQLAGVSVAYYTRLEQGKSRNASHEVIDAIAAALRLDSTERAHLSDLAQPARRHHSPATPSTETVRPRMHQLLNAMDGVPAMVIGRRNDILAWNRLGHALLAGHLDQDSPNRNEDRPNLPRMIFLDPHTHELYSRWEDEARAQVAYLRLVAGRYQDDAQLAELIGELCMKSPRFAQLWQHRRVRDCTFGHKHLHHPLVGPITLTFEALHQPDRPDQRLELFSAEPDSSSEAALRLLDELTARGADRSASTPQSASS
ncbi:helix-turn-helix domain-containing protein [Actinopolyspora mortivallis]|uniref:Transcriptional regulator n=1 Tax=Actinopolyspora mortivallis TaxID=33906 RepID=A0A2T0GVA5_ACTMO|nr:helix-turn-helix transcriptional regulator [Actinopolyspora mortivallis]PRW63048.1 transcriptional regulator [Actinopolyspora mortivallis]